MSQVPPMPVQPLNYGQPLGPRKPGVVTAVGITSIIMAALSGLYCLSIAMNLITFNYIMPRMNTAVPGATTMPVMIQFSKPDQVAQIGMIVTVLLSLALAIYLLVAGIITLRGSLNGRKHHLRWAIMKIPLVLIGSAIYGWWMGSIMSGMWTSLPGAPMPSTMLMTLLYGGGAAVMGLIYPIVALVLMNLKSAKDYYNSLIQ